MNPSEFLPDVLRFLHALEKTQIELADLLADKRQALTAAQTDQLAVLTARESEITGRLSASLQDRAKILQRAQNQGIACDSLRGLALQMGDTWQSEHDALISQCEERSKSLRVESWTHWIISSRVIQHVNELMELIAHSGQSALTYDPQEKKTSSGGAILDASI